MPRPCTREQSPWRQKRFGFFPASDREEDFFVNSPISDFSPRFFPLAKPSFPDDRIARVRSTPDSTVQYERPAGEFLSRFRQSRCVSSRYRTTFVHQARGTVGARARTRLRWTATAGQGARALREISRRSSTRRATSAKKLSLFPLGMSFFICTGGRPARGKTGCRSADVALCASARRLSQTKPAQRGGHGDFLVSVRRPCVRVLNGGRWRKKAPSASAVERRADKAAAVNEKSVVGYSKRYRLK